MRIGYKVCDAMTKKPITVKSNTTLMKCANVLKDNHIGALLVNHNDGLHILTEQDIVRRGVSIGLDPEKTTVAEIMTKMIHTIKPCQDIFEALIKMRDLNIRHLPVIEEEKTIGLLTLKDVLKIEPQLFELLVEKFNQKQEENNKIKDSVKEMEGICNLCGNYFENVIEKDNIFLCNECKNK
jgi:signal-transduction protein with cAMP-binding, CBS, and nucleotidyltransferase domain